MSKKLSSVGIVSSLYMALAYLSGIIIYIVILKYPQITNDLEKIQIILEMKNMYFLTNLLLYVLFGPVLVLFIINLKSNIVDNNSLLFKFSEIVGYIWAGSLTASGMISNGMIEPLTKLFVENSGEAVLLFQSLEIVSTGIGNGNGEILGGLMTLGFGITTLKDSSYSNSIGVFGIIIGIIGVFTTLPILVDFTALFGILQLVWFLLIGFSSVTTGKEFK